MQPTRYGTRFICNCPEMYIIDHDDFCRKCRTTRPHSGGSGGWIKGMTAPQVKNHMNYMRSKRKLSTKHKKG